MDVPFKDKTILITGAGSGFSVAIEKTLDFIKETSICTSVGITTLSDISWVESVPTARGNPSL